MLNFNGYRWIEIARTVDLMRRNDVLGYSIPFGGLKHPAKAHATSMRMSSDYFDDIRLLRNTLVEMGLRGPLASLERLEAKINPVGSDGLIPFEEAEIGNLTSALVELDGRLVDEMKYHIFLSLSPKERDYFEPKEPIFGLIVDRQFSTASFEIDEASKCMALGRYTACGFHLMRCAELALRAFARCLNIPDPTKPAERNWGFILEQSLKPKMDAMTKASVWKTDDKQFFSEIYGSVDAVRSAWRNPTMHVEKIYTEAEAELVFWAMKGFMQKIASRMDEQGLPLA